MDGSLELSCVESQIFLSQQSLLQRWSVDVDIYFLHERGYTYYNFNCITTCGILNLSIEYVVAKILWQDEMRQKATFWKKKLKLLALVDANRRAKIKLPSRVFANWRGGSNRAE